MFWVWKDGLRLTSGETGAEEAGDRWEGGVYGIPPVERQCSGQYGRRCLSGRYRNNCRRARNMKSEDG